MAKLVLILAQSYPHVKNVLYLIDLYINDSAEIKLLIFQNNYLYKFFSEINKEHFNNKVKIKFIPKYSTIYNNIFIKYLLIADKIFLYKYYRLTCRHIAGYTVYFFSKSFTDYGYYYLKKLHSNNKIIHIQDPGCDIYNIINGKPNSLKSLFQLIYAKLLLGKNIVYGDTGRQGFHNFFTISEKYYNKIVERIILQDERDELQSNFTLSKYALTKYSKLKVIYFDKDVVKDGLCDDLQFQNEIEKIFQIISKFVQNNKIGRKYKPNRTTEYNRDRLDIGQIIPDYIPAELLYNDNIDIYFGITSIALSNIEKGNVISLVYLITYLNPENREGTVQNQEKRKKGKKIYYPKNLDELRRLLEEIILDN